MLLTIIFLEIYLFWAILVLWFCLLSLALDVKSESVSESLLNLAEAQSTELRADLLKATTSGSPLYGLLQALYRLLTDPSSPEFQSLDQPQLNRLNSLVDEVVRHLLQILASKSTSITGIIISEYFNKNYRLKESSCG